MRGSGGGAPTPRHILFLVLFLVWSAAAAALWWSEKPDLYGGAVFSREFTDRGGRLLRLTLAADERYRLFTPLRRIPAEMREATLLYEDRAFYRHPGVNPWAMARAVGSMALGGRRMGGSTITMQLTRLTQGLDTTSVTGKLRQMWAALVLERHYGKDEILEAYLNLAPYGGNVEGIGAAAFVWFHKRPEQLTVPEILALTPVPQNPSARNPLHMEAARRRAEKSRGETSGSGKTPEMMTPVVTELPDARMRLDALWREKHPESETAVFARMPLRVYSPSELPDEAPHVVAGLLKTMRPEKKPDTVITTIDLSTQKLVERAMKRSVARGGLWGMDNAAALLLDWRSGEIRALVGSADFYRESIQGQVDGTAARRSPGSTLKPFVYALALEQGLIHPHTVLADTPRSFRGYEPENADGGFRGPINAMQALQGSRNIPAIALASRLREPDLYGFLREAGVAFTESADHYGLALVLGGAEVTARELAGLYATLPNQGLWREPALLQHGEPPEFRRVLSPEAAFVTLDMLRAPSASGAARGVTTYWKTGTSNGLRDAWTAGVFGPYVLVVWVGHFDGASNPGFTGLHAAAPLFFDIVQALRGRESLPDLPRQNADELRLIRVPVCTSTGDLNIALCSGENGGPGGGTTETWFIPGVSPIRDSGILREILVDRETGLRQCREIPGRTERRVWEFWPADMRRLFAQAGISKPRPPVFAPECQQGGMAGKIPEIVSPRPGVVYSRSLSQPGRIPLIADADADVDNIFWFAGKKYLGRSGPGDGATQHGRPQLVPEGDASTGMPSRKAGGSVQKPDAEGANGTAPAANLPDNEVADILFWTPEPGVTELRAVDDLGRSASLRVVVETVP